MRARLRGFALAGTLALLAGCGPSGPPVDEGTFAPALKVVDLADEPQTIAWDGQGVVLVQFWAMACCAEQLPVTAAVHRAYAPRGLRTITINAGNSREELDDVRSQADWPFEMVTDPLFIASHTYDVVGIPTTFLVRDGVLVWRHGGNLTAAQLGAQVATIMDVTPVALREPNARPPERFAAWSGRP